MTYPGIELDILNHRQKAVSRQCRKILRNLHINIEELANKLLPWEMQGFLFLGDKYR